MPSGTPYSRATCSIAHRRISIICASFGLTPNDRSSMPSSIVIGVRSAPQPVRPGPHRSPYGPRSTTPARQAGAEHPHRLRHPAVRELDHRLLQRRVLSDHAPERVQPGNAHHAGRPGSPRDQCSTCSGAKSTNDPSRRQNRYPSAVNMRRAPHLDHVRRHPVQRNLVPDAGSISAYALSNSRKSLNIDRVSLSAGTVSLGYRRTKRPGGPASAAVPSRRPPRTTAGRAGRRSGRSCRPQSGPPGCFGRSTRSSRTAPS
jgi:hypothetical protein